MTDFDFEILAAVALYGEEGVSRKELERVHFNGYEIDYNLRELTETQSKMAHLPDETHLRYSIENSACLKVHAIGSVKKFL